MIHGTRPNGLLQVALYNNAGVSYLERADSQNAERCFRAALQSVQHHVEADDAILVEKPPSLPLYSTPMPFLSDDAFYVFDQAWVLSTAVLNDTTATSRQTIESAAALIVFNLALTFHQLCLLSGDGTMLQRACKMYSLSAQMASTTLDATTHAVLDVVSNNNLAHLHWRCQGDHLKAQELLDGMQTSMARVVLEEEHCVLDLEQLDEISINNVTAQTGPTGTAAAA